jgi:predicted nucleic acid-binding protein
VLCNTSPLLYLHQLGRLELLPALYQRITIPGAVAFELREGARLGHAVPTVAALSWIAVENVDQAPLLRLVADLDEGEREVVALGLGRPGSLLLLDDGQARRYAKMLGLTFTGTLGVLLRAKERGLLDRVRPHLDQLQALGFRLAPAVRMNALRLVGEAEE